MGKNNADQKQNKAGCGIAALIAMVMGCLFLIGVGIFALTVDEPVIAMLGIGIGALGGIFFAVIGVVMIRQRKQGITMESKQQWQSGVLTEKIIKKDLFAHSKTKIISLFAMTGILVFFAVLVVCFAEELTLTNLLVMVSPFVMLVLGVKELIQVKKGMAYRIETDRVLGGEVKTTFDVVDAVTTHLPTRTPVLYLEKHGEYKIDSMHIHAYYPAEALAACIEPGEEVYEVYSVNTNALLHIYRKKYWSVEE